MKITADTNILVRTVVRDDEKQARMAMKLLKEAELIAVPAPVLCEFVWVLSRLYRFNHEEIVAALDALLEAANVVVDRPAVDAGLAVLKVGGDFADGLIAYEGEWLGAETFVSFDSRAVALLSKQGYRAKLLA
jgi:predicted nucleic-acid-binding protein